MIFLAANSELIFLERQPHPMQQLPNGKKGWLSTALPLHRLQNNVKKNILGRREAGEPGPVWGSQLMAPCS